MILIERSAAAQWLPSSSRHAGIHTSRVLCSLRQIADIQSGNICWISVELETWTWNCISCYWCVMFVHTTTKQHYAAIYFTISFDVGTFLAGGHYSKTWLLFFYTINVVYIINVVILQCKIDAIVESASQLELMLSRDCGISKTQ